ncbi:MAG: ABC transporter permease [Nanoarchaeota archaeon]|nr:ABC transporter permease [Nanoarchaeota archaeon]
MNISEIKYSLNNLISRKLRSFLTVLSILIGVMAIFAIVSFGLGIRNYMDVIAEEAGTDKLFIQSRGVGAPGTDDTFSFSKDEVDFVGKINGVDRISGMYMKVGEIEFHKQKKFFFATGLDMDEIDFLLEVFTVDIMKGRQLKKGETGKVALGYSYQFPNKLFKKAMKLGDKIELNGEKVEVVGFYEQVGNPQDDSNIYLTSEGFESLYPDSKDKFGWAMIKSDRNVDPEQLADKIEDKLRKYKGEEKGKETFFVQTFADALETFGTIINILNGILFLIALVSVIVASVNIMNTMYTAVLERTQEIGIMKSIGARNSDILLIFIFESGFLGMVGGLMGIIFGFIIAKSGGAVAAASGFTILQPSFPWYLTVGCLFFAFLVGAASGILPAIQASKLKPVDSLRYE